jgi:CBS domain containing-hemolysin-like protein
MPDDPSSHNESSGERDATEAPAAAPRPKKNGEGEGWIARVLRAFGWKPATARDELEVVLEEGAPAAETGFSPEEQAMLRNILGLRERRIEDVMLPRADIIAVQQDISLGDLVRVFENAGHSRLVVYNDTLDDPMGMVHIRDLIGFMTAHAAVKPRTKSRRKKPLPAGLDLGAIDLSIPLSSTEIVRALLFVPPSMPAIDLLAKMQATRIHLALVIDEYGGTDGLVSIEDIVELIVGDIADEHDEDEAPNVIRQLDGSFIVDARASLEDVTKTIGEEFDVGGDADDVDTFGGYLVTKTGRVPVRGEFVPGPGQFEIEVLDADPRRVKKVRIYPSRARRLERNREIKRRQDLLSVAYAPSTSVDQPAGAEGDAPQKNARRP